MSRMVPQTTCVSQSSTAAISISPSTTRVAIPACFLIRETDFLTVATPKSLPLMKSQVPFSSATTLTNPVSREGTRV